MAGLGLAAPPLRPMLVGLVKLLHCNVLGIKAESEDDEFSGYHVPTLQTIR
jgi:hypothetical protein